MVDLDLARVNLDLPGVDLDLKRVDLDLKRGQNGPSWVGSRIWLAQVVPKGLWDVA